MVFLVTLILSTCRKFAPRRADGPQGSALRYGLTLVALVLIATPFAQASAQSVSRGPYLQSGAPSSVVVRWRTSSATNSVVRYGTSLGNLDQSATASSSTTEHVVEVNDLLPQTKYFYSVGTSSQTLAGSDADHFFVTSPPTGVAKPTRIWVVGDSGTANSNAASVRNAYLSYANANGEADLMMMLGDNAYDTGTDQEYQNAVFDFYPTVLRNTVLWPTIGNHDSGNSSNQTGTYFNVFSLPKLAQAGGVASGTEAYYSFDYGNIHFVTLDSHNTSPSPGGAMLTWLEQDIANTNQDWIIAYWHHPPYSKGSHDSDSEGRLVDMRQNVLPILEAYGVDLVMSGHSHSYERSYLLDGHYGASNTLTSQMIVDGGDGREGGDGAYFKPVGDPHEGAVYVVAGSSGKRGGGSLNHPAMFVSLSELGSLIIDVNGDRLDVQFLRENGSTPDNFTLLKGADTLPPQATMATALSATLVEVQFSEPLQPSSAQTSSNYGLSGGVSVIGAALLANNRNVRLTTGALSAGQTYTVSISNVQDLGGNAVAPGTSVQFEYLNQFSVQARVSQSSDDAEQRSDTSMFLNSIDLELVTDGLPQTVGLRFQNLDIPHAAQIGAAYIEFEADETGSDSTNLTIRGQDADNPATFGTNNNNITNRPLTDAAVNWAPGPWTTVSQKHQSPDLSQVIQEIVDRPNWQDGNAMVFVITGSGRRTAESYEGEASNAPLLHVEYSLAVADTEAPSIPTSLIASETTDAATTLMWTASIDNIGVVAYEVFRDGQFVGSSATPSYADSALAASTTYSYQVRAVDEAGNSSSLSDTLAITTAVSPPPLPGVATSPTPDHAAPQISLNPLLSWTAGADTDSFAVYFGTDPSPGAAQFQGTQAATSYAPATLAQGTTYYWRIDATNATGTTPGNVWQFSTHAYCPVSGNTSYEFIDSVTIDGTVNASGDDGGYADYSAPAIGLSSRSFLVSLGAGYSGTAYSERWAIYIDTDQSGSFEASELVFAGSGAAVVQGSAWLPASAPQGETGLRVIMNWSQSPFDPCEGPNWGEVEDYRVIIPEDSGDVGVGAAQTPWRAIAPPIRASNVGWHNAMGYHFTANEDGRITALGGLFAGTKTIRLFDRASGEILGETTVTASSDWAYGDLAVPVDVLAGRSYTVAVYLDGSGGSYQYPLVSPLPQISGSIEIEASTYVYTGTAGGTVIRPTNAINSLMYGVADIRFEPAGGGPSP